MKGKMRIRWYSIALSVLCLSACQVKRPDTVLPDATMENVLYDYHIAKAMGEDIPYNDSYKKVLYVESVFKKHGITQAQFDSSMVWFARNPDALTKVYEKVNQRLKARRDGINHLIALREKRPKSSRPGDSIDVWFGQRIYQLTGMPLDNKVAFTIPSDSRMERAIMSDVQSCVEDKAVSFSGFFGEEASALASLFLSTEASAQSISEQYRKNNRTVIERSWFWSVGKIYNRNTPDGTNVCFGIFGIVIPYVAWEDFILMNEE